MDVAQALHGLSQARVSNTWLCKIHLARFKHAKSALVFNSGYTANMGVISSIARAGDLILSDEFNDASIIDGCRLSRGATERFFAHCNTSALEELLGSSVQAGHKGKIVVVTDSVFSMDGDWLLDCTEIADLCRRYHAILVVDEAHAHWMHWPRWTRFGSLSWVESMRQR